VRQKLVKAEKDREDTLKEMVTIKEREKGDKDKEQAERLNFLRELEATRTTHTQDVSGLKSQFEKDVTALRERYEHEISALRGQRELDLATVKVGLNGTPCRLLFAEFVRKGTCCKNSQISTLEKSLNGVTREKNNFFDQLQLRQAEVESMQARLSTMQHQNTELEFQLRDGKELAADLYIGEVVTLFFYTAEYSGRTRSKSMNFK